MGWIIFIIVILLVIFVISIYNSLVTLRQRVKNAWSQIEVQLQRRFDLIPNLVETVKGYMGHESEVLTKIAELRTSWANAKTVTEKSELDTQLSESLKTIMAVSESYPDLKANTNFINLQDELAGTENRIATARRDYNEAVKSYNSLIIKFPNNIVASMFNLTKADHFKADSSKTEVPNVEF